MIFRKAEKEDFYKIRSLYWNLIDQEKDDPSFSHWKKGIYPSDEMIQNSIEREELYVLADGDEIAACVIANDEKVEGYADAPWQIDSDEVIVLHVLAVHPNHRGKGFASSTPSPSLSAIRDSSFVPTLTVPDVTFVLNAAASA